MKRRSPNENNQLPNCLNDTSSPYSQQTNISKTQDNWTTTAFRPNHRRPSLSLPSRASVQSRSDLIRLNVYATKCLQKRSDDFENGNIIHLWDCDIGPIGNKAFYYDPETGYIRSSLKPSKCLHKKSPGFKVWDTVHLWDCDGGVAQNKTFDYNDRLGRISFKDDPTYCLNLRNLEFDNGNPLVVQRCQYAYAFTMPVAKPAEAAKNQKGPSCVNVRLAYETLVLEVKTGNAQGAGSSATMKIRIFFDDWDTGTFDLNPNRSFYAGGLDKIETGIWIPIAQDGNCGRKNTNIKSIVIDNTGSSGVFSSDAWQLESICARSSLQTCIDSTPINQWIYGGKRYTAGRDSKP